MPDSWVQGDGSAMDRAWLADWRRRVAEPVRRGPPDRCDGPCSRARTTGGPARERLYRDHPQSPVPADARAAFHAAHFEHDPSLRFEVTVEPAPPPPPGASALRLPESDGGDTLAFSRIGRIAIPFADGPRTLAVYWMSGYTGGLFIPFRDATNGTDTYGAGRYLVDGAKSADLGGDPARGTLTIDFNFAYQPSCAFDPRWACPLAPPENRLDRPIRAGERL